MDSLLIIYSTELDIKWEPSVTKGTGTFVGTARQKGSPGWQLT